MSLKVLLADDSMTAQNMGKKILAESGYDVTTVSNGAAAVKKIAEVKPDVVILDIYMPGYTGLEVCERVRANMDTANLPVLLTVGKMEPYRAEDGAKVRADGVIVKPFEATDLLAVVKKMAEKAPGNRRPVVESEPEPEEEIGQPEPAMPSSVEVPSELASTPALVMDEFVPNQPQVAEFKPAMEWTAAPEIPVEETPVPTLEVAPQIAEVPWSFDQVETPSAQPAETVAAEEGAGAIEFTSAPKAGYVEVEQVTGLEAGLNAEPTPDVQVARDPALTDATEMTDFVTSFGETKEQQTAEPAAEEAAEMPPSETPAEVTWDGWAHAEPTPSEPEATLQAASEPAVEQHSKPVMDDFEAKVAAAMAGFSVEPVEPQHQVAHAETAETEVPPADDFEARVAAAMSGFATEPVEGAAPEAVTEAHEEFAAAAAAGTDDFEARLAAAMSGFSGGEAELEAPQVEAPAEMAAPAEEPAVETHIPELSQQDFDARIAQALAGFDTAPQTAEEAVRTSSETAAEAQHEPAASVPSISLNEAALLPQEAMLSLEEEMKQALTQHVPEMLAATPELASVPAEGAPVEAESAASVEEIPAQPEASHDFEPVQEAAAVQGVSQNGVAEVMPADTAVRAELESETAAVPEKFADAVQRAFDRLKPQLIAEIVKELKRE